MNPGRPDSTEYAPAYANYVGLVAEDDVLAALDAQRSDIEALGARIPRHLESFRYADGKWTVRQLLRHIADAERVMSYRALSFARGDDAKLPGFEETLWAAAAPAENVTVADLIDELLHLRAANLRMFQGLGSTEWSRRGVASEREMSVRALAFVLVGHLRHHLGVLEARYLGAA
jgi:hypothetical protein